MTGAKLPNNWRLELEYRGDTGYGDGRMGYALYRWGGFTTGRLWWKKRKRGWIFKRWDALWTEEEATELAAKTERMLSAA